MVILIGIDPHKSSHTAAALDTQSHGLVDRVRIDATAAEYRRLLAWAKRVCDRPGERRWAIENAEGLGRHLAQWLLARGETVVDVPATPLPGCASCPAAASARPTYSTPLLR